jgi:hypothetical protein
MSEPLKLEPSQRLYRKFSTAFVAYHGPCVVREDVYDQTRGRLLRAWRRDHDVTLRELAAVLGIRVVELSGLEWGQYACDWDDLDCRLRSFVAGAKECGHDRA